MRKLKLKLFGSFSLTDGFVVVDELTLHSKKILQLLVYILLNRNEVLSQQSLTESLWEGRSSNPEGALKNLMYRLRIVMKELGEEEFICTMPRAYKWNPEIKVKVDCEEYEELASRLRRTLPEEQEKRRELCREITESYNGNVTPLIADEPWILSRVIRYRSVYLDAARTLCGIYEQENSWEELEQLSEQALLVDPLDEDLCCSLLQALYGQKKYDLMILRYEKIGKLFYESMGISHPEKPEALIRKLMTGRKTTEMDLNCFIEEAGEQENSGGVFFCDYQIFRQLYQIEARRVDRLGTMEYMMLMTVRRSGNLWKDPAEDQGLQEGVDILERVLRRQLRSGDVVSQFSPTQYIILLTACTYESGVLIARRIKKRFRKGIGLRKLSISSELAEVQAVKQKGKHEEEGPEEYQNEG